MRFLMTAFTLGAALLISSQALAQTTPPAVAPTPIPAGGTPEQMPFVIPYGTPITADRASRLVAAALTEARKHPSWQEAVAVVDPSGDLGYFYRMDGAQAASADVAVRKARTSARYRRETRVFYNVFETGHPYIATIDPTLAASIGGFPLIEGGKVIGAIGCSGGTGVS